MDTGAIRAAVMAETFEKANQRHHKTRRLIKWYYKEDERSITFEYYIEGVLGYMILRAYGPAIEHRICISVGHIGLHHYKQPAESDFDFISELVQVFRVLIY